jgi:hypothetical protein
VFKVVHRRGAYCAPHWPAVIKHCEFNNHPTEVEAQYFTSLKWHCDGLRPAVFNLFRQ